MSILHLAVFSAASGPSRNRVSAHAVGQLALHYWIASFGTLGNYAAKLGLTEAKHNMRTSLDEAKQADLQHTASAEKILAQNRLEAISRAHHLWVRR